jgi:hypothetical protein
MGSVMRIHFFDSLTSGSREMTVKKWSFFFWGEFWWLKKGFALVYDSVPPNNGE